MKNGVQTERNFKVDKELKSEKPWVIQQGEESFSHILDNHLQSIDCPKTTSFYLHSYKFLQNVAGLCWEEKNLSSCDSFSFYILCHPSPLNFSLHDDCLVLLAQGEKMW